MLLSKTPALQRACHGASSQFQPFRGSVPKASRVHRLQGAPCSATVSSSLISVLKDELKIEKEKYRGSAALEEGPPSSWELVSDEGTTVISLTREEGKEQLIVQVVLDEQSDTVDDEEEFDDQLDELDMISLIRFTVTVMKGDKVLSFECQTNGELIVINALALDDGAGGDNGPTYTGPLYDDLDETLQQAFVDYLEERGVNIELGQYLLALANDKMQCEYMGWLKRMKEFLAE